MAEIWITLRTPHRRALTVLVDEPLVVGRDCDGVILADQRVSRRHTSFEPTEDGLVVTDLHSSNGTTVNGVAIGEPTLVAAGDLVEIGNTMVTVQAGEAGARGATTLAEFGPQRRPSVKSSIELVADAIEQEGADSIGAEVVGAGQEPGTLTVMFTDIESSTERALSMGDSDYFELLGRHHQLVTAHVEAHKGRIVKNQGDGYMLCFRSARQALLTCIGLQRDLDRLSPEMTGDGDQLRVRMGAHTGEVMVQDDGDLFGKHVIVAARIGDLAAGGQVLVSSLSKQIAEPRGDIPFGPPIETRLKGLDTLMVVHEVNWSEYVSS